MKKLLLEGGVAGHLAHLYDNKNLSFNKIAKILSLASRGELVGTEKTDGYNIYLGYKDGKAKSARNKTHMRAGGIDADELAAREFQGGEEVKKAYTDSFEAFEAAAESLTPEEREKVFGENGEIFYNSEIMGPGASNVVNYDTNVITIHHGGHKRYDPLEDNVVDVEAKDNSAALDKVVDKFEQALAGKKFGVQKTAFLELKALDNDSHLKATLERMKAAGFSGEMTIGEFLEQKLEPEVKKRFGYLHDEIKQDIIDKILARDGAKSLTVIYKGLPQEQKGEIRDFIKGSGKLLSRAIWPIEDAIHDFAVEMLRGLESAYILDNQKEIERLKSEISNAITAIQSYSGPGAEEAAAVLVKQLQKIKHLDNISSAAEGFVFEYEGQLYKFTGNFAPINQILGLFRYGRGSVPAISGQENEQIKEQEAEMTDNRTVAIVPGAFKPPHRGHLDMVKHYSGLADEVLVMVSKLPRKTPEGNDITVDDAIRVWQIYLESAGLGNVFVNPSEHASPVRAAYEFVEKDAEFGDQVILGTSTKGGDQSRFAKNVQKYAKKGVKVLDPMEYAFSPVGIELSARDFRAVLDSGQDISPFLPVNVDPNDVLSVLKPSRVENDTIFEIIEQILDEIEPIQRKWTEKHAKMRLTTKGKTVKEPPFDENPPSERSKSAPPIGEVEELEEMSAMAGGAVEAGSGPFPGIDKEKDREDLKIKRKKKPKKSMIREEEIISQVMDYLLQNGPLGE